MDAKALALAALFVLAAAPVAAQEMKIEAKPSAREPAREIVAPGLHYEQTRPADRDYYLDGPRVEHDPAFIEALSGEYQTANSTGRAGVSGWTSPNTPVGPAIGGQREVTGWFGVGLSVTWGGPPRVARRPTR